MKEKLRAGLEAQYISSRHTKTGETGGFVVVNLSLTSDQLVKGLGLSFTVFNLFDEDYADPAATEHVQDKRSFRGVVAFKF